MKHWLTAYPRLNGVVLAFALTGAQFIVSSSDLEVLESPNLAFAPFPFIFGAFGPPLLAYFSATLGFLKPPKWQRVVERYVNGHYLVSTMAFSIAITTYFYNPMGQDDSFNSLARAEFRSIGIAFMAGAGIGFILADIVMVRRKVEASNIET